jgi:hypothetical protein
MQIILNWKRLYVLSLSIAGNLNIAGLRARGSILGASSSSSSSSPELKEATEAHKAGQSSWYGEHHGHGRESHPHAAVAAAEWLLKAELEQVAWLADLVTDSQQRWSLPVVGDHGGGGEPSPLAYMVAGATIPHNFHWSRFDWSKGSQDTSSCLDEIAQFFLSLSSKLSRHMVVVNDCTTVWSYCC